MSRIPPAIVSCMLSTSVSRRSSLWLLPYIEKTESIGVMVPQATLAPYNDVVNTGNVSINNVHKNRHTMRSLAEWN